MADKKSRELDEKVADGLFQDVKYTGWGKEKAKPLTMKLDVDVSEALTGLKALQREAREATKALRELEAVKRNAE